MNYFIVKAQVFSKLDMQWSLC